MKRRRILASESNQTAPLGLPIGARDRVNNLFRPDRAQVPSLEASDDGAQPRARRAGGEAATSALGRFPLARDCRPQRFGDLRRGLETLDTLGHHIKVPRPADLAARRSQSRDRHSSRLAHRNEEKPRNRARFFQRLTHVMDPLRGLIAGSGELRRR